MIRIEKLTQDDVGKWVIYQDIHADKQQKGRIKSWNDTWIFVVYQCAGEWDRFQDYTGVPTNPEDLHLAL